MKICHSLLQAGFTGKHVVQHIRSLTSMRVYILSRLNCMSMFAVVIEKSLYLTHDNDEEEWQLREGRKWLTMMGPHSNKAVWSRMSWGYLNSDDTHTHTQREGQREIFLYLWISLWACSLTYPYPSLLRLSTSHFSSLKLILTLTLKRCQKPKEMSESKDWLKDPHFPNMFQNV